MNNQKSPYGNWFSFASKIRTVVVVAVVPFAAMATSTYRCADKNNSEIYYEVHFSEDDVRAISVSRWSQTDGVEELFSHRHVYGDEIDLANECFYAVSEFPTPWLSFECNMKNRRGRVKGDLALGYGSQNKFVIANGPQVFFRDCDRDR